MDLIEAILTAITDVNNFDDLGSQPWVKHVTLAEFCLEIGRAREDQSSYIDFVVSNKMLDCQLSHFANVVVSLFVSKASGANLTTSTRTAIRATNVSASTLAKSSAMNL